MTIGGSIDKPPPGLLSVIVAAEPMQELTETLASVRPDLDAMDRPYEVICATDGRDGTIMAALNQLSDEWPELLVLGQRPWRDDDAALTVAMRRARGELVLTLAGWPEVAPEDLPRLPEMLGDADMLTVARKNRPQDGWQGWRRRRFTRLLARLFGHSPSDPFCRTRLARRAVLDDVTGFGVRQHFIPVIAGLRGYKLTEVELRSASSGSKAPARYVFRPLGHFVAFFDAITLYVVLNFLRRPLRFFGAIGMPIFVFGMLATAVLIGQKLMGEPLADRPALIFAVLMVVMGVQIVAIGLVGEIVIFANSRRLKQYAVREIITGADLSDTGGLNTSNVISPRAFSNDG
ncbi:glycosyl transferase family 2 [Citreicella sp. C3M06]|uniref:glycosyltransferase n=1 Tax=Roseobacteraceae TaxID=2854170 RepID=UPI001C07F398|nr:MULTISPECIES: glycosyltransferase [Roseobacteraceae]MBU2960324.1 glycosyl transferase family 2 [Citreicella sp. C3M06]MDO6587028.1 glycosyl transferase family 2 [Salipiger sp. 1_MG-2023]